MHDTRDVSPRHSHSWDRRRCKPVVTGSPLRRNRIARTNLNSPSAITSAIFPSLPAFLADKHFTGLLLDLVPIMSSSKLMTWCRIIKNVLLDRVIKIVSNAVIIWISSPRHIHVAPAVGPLAVGEWVWRRDMMNLIRSIVGHKVPKSFNISKDLSMDVLLS